MTAETRHTSMNATQRQQTNSPSAQEIAICAYAIWEKEGRPRGRDVDHWLQAKTQLEVDRRQDSLPSVKGAIAAALAEHKARRSPVLRKGTASTADRPRSRKQAQLLAE